MKARRLLLNASDRTPTVIAAPRTCGGSLARIGGPWLHGFVEARSIQVMSKQHAQIEPTHLRVKVQIIQMAQLNHIWHLF